MLASEEHKGLNETLLRDYPNHQFVAGGATLERDKKRISISP